MKQQILEPQNKNILIEVHENEEYTTASGIVIEQSIKRQDYKGIYATAIAVGRAAEGVRTGDRVLVNQYDVIPFRDADRELGVIVDTAVLAIDRRPR